MIRAILPKKIRRQRPPEMIRVAIRAMKAAIASPMKGSRNHQRSENRCNLRHIDKGLFLDLRERLEQAR